ncbi:MAG TPA: energy-coupling factor transporter ATPase [Treponemataceae bacterium]|nr:energy-coupling factor transporter ATPase [Treponemataceae bacterium]
MILLEANDISYTYPHMKKKALDSVSLEIYSASYTAILGENGSGKSTLGKILAGILVADSGSIIAHEKPVGIVFQSPKHQIIAGEVLKDSSLGPENMGKSRKDAKKIAREALKEIGLAEKMDANTLSLSLGQMQKLAMAGIIALSPKTIIFDEALSMIDPGGRQEILALIDDLHERGKTIISITHDEDEAKKAERIYFMQEGKIQSIIDKKDFENDADLRAFFHYPLDTEQKQAIKEDKKKPTISIDSVSFSYQNAKQKTEKGKDFFQNLSLQFCSSSLTAIMGPSGSGKTTLFELIAGLLEAKDGEILSSGKVALSLQDANAALFEEFAVDDIAFGPRNQGLKGKKLLERVQKAMALVNLDYDVFKDKKTLALSGGQKRKLSLAGIIALDSDILLFDEPTAGLDPKSRSEIMATMKALANAGKTVIFSTHRKEEGAFADRLILLEEGTVIYDEAPSKIRQEEKEGLKTVKRSEGKILAGLQRGIGSDYMKKNTALHRAKPLPSFLLFLALFVLSIALQSPKSLGALSLFSILYTIISQFPLKKIIKRIFLVLPWIALLLFFQILFFGTRPGDIVYTSISFFSKWTLSLTSAKIELCIKTFLHFFNVLIALSVYNFTKTETEIIEGFEDFLKPLCYIKVPVKYIKLLFLLVFRFIPLLLDEAASILKTQIIREGIKETKGLFKTVKIFLPLFIPLVLQTIRRAEYLSDALIARQY